MQSLINLLTQLLAVYQQLVQLAADKRQVLVAMKVPELEQITRQEEKLLSQVEEMEAQRRSLMRKLFPDQQNLTLSQLKTLVPDSLRPEIEQLGQEFIVVTKKWQLSREANQQLLQQGLHLVNFSINVLTQNVAGPTYAPGSDGGGHSRSLFDQKA